MNIFAIKIPPHLVRSPWSLVRSYGLLTTDYGLFSFKLRLPLLRVGIQAFLRVLTLEQLLQQLAFKRQRFRLRKLQSCLHRSLDQSDSLACLGGRNKLLRVLEHFLEEIFFFE